MIKPLNSLLPYNTSEKTKPGRQTALAWVQTRPTCRNLAQAGKEKTFSGLLVHAYHCPRGNESWGMMNTEGCGACSTLITPQWAPGSGTRLVWAPSHPTERTCRWDLSPLVNITIKKVKSGIFYDFCSYLLQAKCHCSLLVLNCHWIFNDDRENKWSFWIIFFFERMGLVLISSMLSYTRSTLLHTHKVTHE